MLIISQEETMKVKMLGTALIVAFMAIQGFAQECNEVSLYKNGETGSVATGSTFPEAPEWQANWGTMGRIIPPYIRWSGSMNEASNWETSLVLNNLPTYVQGGNLKLDIRATKAAKVGIWLEGEFGKSLVHYQGVDSGKTESISIPVADLIGTGKNLVQKLGIGLFNVPAKQYTTLFLDNVSLNCGVSETIAQLATDTTIYPFSDVQPNSTIRNPRFLHTTSAQMTAAYTAEERSKAKDSTSLEFLLDENEHLQIVNYINTSRDSSSKLTAVKSREGWYKVMYLIDRSRLRDTVIANPKALFYEANTFASDVDNTEMPLLVGNVDYGYRVCADTACGTEAIESARALVAGLPSATVKGSILRIHYDPYFIATTRNAIPQLEIYSKGSWSSVPIRSSFDVFFEGAGRETVKVRLTEGGQSITQDLIVEVK